jgi:hypothetical protein
MKAVVEESNLYQQKEEQSLTSDMESELQRLSFGVRYAVPIILPGWYHHWGMLKDANECYPAFPREVDLVGTYDVYYVASKGGLLSRMRPGGRMTGGVTKGTLQLSIQGSNESENGRLTRLVDYLSVKCLKGNLSFDSLTEEHDDVSDLVLEQTERSESHGHPGSIRFRVHPRYLGGASLYTVGHHGAIPFPSKMFPDDGLVLPARVSGQRLLDHYKYGISVTMHLNLPVELGRLVRDFIGPPPVLMVEPGDLVLSFHNRHQTLLARPSHKKQPPPPPPPPPLLSIV